MQQLICKRFFLILGLLAGLGTLTAVVAQTSGTTSEEVEESPLLDEPKTPEEIFDATVLMIDLARPKLARRYLDQLMQAKPDDAQLLKFRDKHGSAIFLRLANVKELKPVSTKLLEQVNQAFRNRSSDPAVIDRIIADLSGSPQEREIAVTALRNAGPVVIPRIVYHLGKSESPDKRDELVNTLSQLGKQMIPALVGSLDTPNDDLRISVIDSLGWLKSRHSVPYLWFPAFAESQTPGVRLAARRALIRILDSSVDVVRQTSTADVADQLGKTALTHFRNEFEWNLDLEDNTNVPIWAWDVKSQTVKLNKLSPQAASLYVGTTFSRQALELAPNNEKLQAQLTAFSLASDMFHSGAERKLTTGPGTAHDISLTVGADVLSNALKLALDNSNANAAIASLQVLSQIAPKHQIYKTASHQSPLTAALNYPDLQVQFSAAQAILQLDPNRPFRGSKRVVSILGRSLNDTGSPQAVVAHGNVARGSIAASLMNEIGYNGIAVQTGREAFQVASERSDIEIILLSVNVTHWELSQTIANLRADARTASIPIAIFGPKQVRDHVETLLTRFSSVVYLEEFNSSDFLEVQLRPYLHKFKSTPLSGPQRALRKAAAAFWIAHIADGRRTDIFDLRSVEDALISSLSDPNLSENAMRALGAVPSNNAQQQLQVTAIGDTLEDGLREQAALQLAFHIQKHGLLLSADQVSEIYTAWKTTTSPDLATAFASVIGSLKPNTKRVSGLLRSSPHPMVPAGTEN